MSITLAKFGAHWCQACLVMDSIIDEFKENYPDVHIVRVDVDESPEITAKRRVTKIPTVIFFAGYKTVDRINSSCSLERLEEAYEKCGGE